MAKFKGAKLVRDIRKALDRGQAQFVTNTQSKLSAGSPVDTGRLASSWYVQKDSPDRAVAPERTEPGIRDGGSASIVIEQYAGRITFDGEWFVSNNLPYARRAAFDPGYVGRRGGGSGDWFSVVINNLQKDADRIFQRELKKVK